MNIIIMYMFKWDENMSCFEDMTDSKQNIETQVKHLDIQDEGK